MIRKSLIPLSLILAGSLLGGCSRALPSEWPSSSPASPDAAQVAPATVTLAVDEDPPLPGEASDGWFGLQHPASSDAQAHQHHQHGSARPAPSGGEHVH